VHYANGSRAGFGVDGVSTASARVVVKDGDSMTRTLPERAVLDAAWQHADERRVFRDAHHAKFVEAYPDQFVAVDHGEVIAHDADLLSLVQQLRATGHDLRAVWIEFMATDRHKLLL
jgi:hypothetical protein